MCLFKSAPRAAETVGEHDHRWRLLALIALAEFLGM
jgi:hypothetical protein